MEKTGTLVILPLRSLMQDFIRKLWLWRVRYTYFNTVEKVTRLDTEARLILVSANQCRHLTFQAELTRYEQKVKIRRICVDEAHRSLTDEEYHPTLQDLYDLRWAEDQTIMLMTRSTLCDMLPHLVHLYGLTENPFIYHEPFNNPNLSTKSDIRKARSRSLRLAKRWKRTTKASSLYTLIPKLHGNIVTCSSSRAWHLERD